MRYSACPLQARSGRRGAAASNSFSEPVPVQNKVTKCNKPEFNDYIKIIMNGAGLPMLSVFLVFLYFKFSLVTLLDCSVPLFARLPSRHTTG